MLATNHRKVPKLSVLSGKKYKHFVKYVFVLFQNWREKCDQIFQLHMTTWQLDGFFSAFLNFSKRKKLYFRIMILNKRLMFVLFDFDRWVHMWSTSLLPFCCSAIIHHQLTIKTSLKNYDSVFIHIQFYLRCLWLIHQHVRLLDDKDILRWDLLAHPR